MSLLASGPAIAAGDASTLPGESCSNEALGGFRPYLPDCRAYEMVTPPYKDGNSNMQVQAVASEGSHVIVSSLSAFAGTESDPLDAIAGAMYELTRTSAGWEASSVTPPTSLSSNAHMFGVSADASKVLWEVIGTPKSVYSTNLDLREQDGSFVEVGPLIAPGGAGGPSAGKSGGGENEFVGFAGASDDLSHVLFTIFAIHPEFLWPGDTTTPGAVTKSLYEYLGTGNKQPMLVGVDGDGHLISDCGIYLGSTEPGGRDTYNAMSADGETVFFTPSSHEESGCEPATTAPEVDELYARLDQIQTIAISEPPPSACKVCQTSVRQKAIFQGASEDGSKVFFLTEQELFAGDIGKSLYEYDFDNPSEEKIVRVSGGAPGYESLDPEVEGVARVSEDGSHVYFVARGVLSGMNSEKKSPVVGANNLYVFERDDAYPSGHTAFIATLSSETKAELEADETLCMALEGEEKEECERASKREFQERNGADSGDWSQEDSRPVQATPEGRFVVFESSAGLAGNAGGLQQVFEYDSRTEKLVRVSIGAAGYSAGVASASLQSSSIHTQAYGEQSAPAQRTTDLAVSANGSRVVFYSMAALTEGADAGALNVYEYQSEGSEGSIANGDVYLINPDASKTEGIGLDASGVDAFFITANPLVSADVDTQIDFYDAREDGGFPIPVVPTACSSEACQGEPSSLPEFGRPASIGLTGSGNPMPPPLTTLEAPSAPTPKSVKCKKDYTKKKGKCIRKREKKSKAPRGDRRAK
ncbi:MAG: hypothetical protein ABSH36_00035 [Solirubrobacteraceae bacterium]